MQQLSYSRPNSCRRGISSRSTTQRSSQANPYAAESLDGRWQKIGNYDGPLSDSTAGLKFDG